MKSSEELGVMSSISAQFETLSIPAQAFVLGSLQADVNRNRTAPARRVLSRKRTARKGVRKYTKKAGKTGNPATEPTA